MPASKKTLLRQVFLCLLSRFAMGLVPEAETHLRELTAYRSSLRLPASLTGTHVYRSSLRLPQA
jgi:hypothetical protein